MWSSSSASIESDKSGVENSVSVDLFSKAAVEIRKGKDVKLIANPKATKGYNTGAQQKSIPRQRSSCQRHSSRSEVCFHRRVHTGQVDLVHGSVTVKKTGAILAKDDDIAGLNPFGLFATTCVQVVNPLLDEKGGIASFGKKGVLDRYLAAAQKQAGRCLGGGLLCPELFRDKTTLVTLGREN